jgi:hypothetical protein
MGTNIFGFALQAPEPRPVDLCDDCDSADDACEWHVRQMAHVRSARGSVNFKLAMLGATFG